MKNEHISIDKYFEKILHSRIISPRIIHSCSFKIHLIKVFLHFRFEKQR